MKKFFRNNGLSLVLGVMFFVFWGCQAVSGWKVNNERLALHGRELLGFPRYLGSGHFWGATGENWESEFLQMGCYVVLTCFLYQKGSAESKDPDEQDSDPTEACPKSAGFFYRNSLSLAFVVLFLGSFAIHATGGLVNENEERSEANLPQETLTEFVSSADFWFQSFQNWQSEFLAVLSIVTLTIFFRQRGSPESKPIDAPDSQTGG